jgi:WD40 repeat protein
VSEEQKVIGAIDAAQLPNGEFVVSGAEPVHDEDGNVVHIAFSGLRIVDPASGESRVVTECDLLDTGSGPGVTCEDGEPPFGIVCCHTWLLASPDGAFFAASSTATSADFDGTRLIRVWDTATLEVVRTIEVPRAFELSGLGDSWVSVTKDGSTAAKVFDLDEGKLIAEVAWEDRPTMSEGARFEVTSDGSHVLSPVWESFVIYETGSWTEVARWQGHDALIRGFSLSDDETRLATTAEDGTVRVWDVSSILDSGSTAESRPPLLDEIPTEVASDVRWMSNSELGLAIRSGSWRTVSLDTDELVRHVWSRLTRSFTAGECQSFRIDPCPSLDELREG